MRNPDSPTAAQLAATRLAHWHHNAQPLLTLEALRDWLSTSGIVLYAPRPQLAVPAPSFLETVLGAANPTPTLAETNEARTLLVRLISEGAAVPLNLLGSTTGTETPDFLVSPATFTFIFTLRGEKAWKQPPTTSGALKVSPLALAAYNLLAQKRRLAASELAAELGKEVTETATLRALTELWQHLRVLPVPQVDGGPTLWELVTARFTKQIKAGANAGQPTAISALISLYLGQAVLPTEEEAEVFLSPLAARSRIREVIHALIAARQLETVVVEGKTTLHVAGELPTFEPIVEPAPEIVETTVSFPTAAEPPQRPRISKFAGNGPRREGDRFPPRFPSRPPRKDFERRPFRREAKPDYTKPWEEEKRQRFSRPRPSGESVEGSASERPYPRERPTERRGGTRPAFSREGRRERYEDRKPRQFQAEGSASERRPSRGFEKPGPYPKRRNEKSFNNQDKSRPFARRESSKLSSKREGSRPFSPRDDRKPFAEGTNIKPKRFEGEKSFGGKNRFGEKKGFSARGKQEFSSAKPYGKKPFSKPRAKSEGRPSGKATGRPPGKPNPFKKFMGDKRPFGKRKEKPE